MKQICKEVYRGTKYSNTIKISLKCLISSMRFTFPHNCKSKITESKFSTLHALSNVSSNSTIGNQDTRSSTTSIQLTPAIHVIIGKCVTTSQVEAC